MKNMRFFAGLILFISSVGLGIVVFNNLTQTLDILKSNSRLIFPLSATIFSSFVYTLIAVFQKENIPFFNLK